MTTAVLMAKEAEETSVPGSTETGGRPVNSASLGEGHRSYDSDLGIMERKQGSRLNKWLTVYQPKFCTCSKSLWKIYLESILGGRMHCR